MPFLSGIGGVWLTALLALWAVVLVGSALASWLLPKAEKFTTRLRLASSATLVVAAWVWYAVALETGVVGVVTFALLLAVGMMLGLLGDLALAQVLPLKQHFLLGMAAFAVGHIYYISAILSMTPHLQWAAEGIALLMGLAGWYLLVYRSAEAEVLDWAALPYALLLATTAGLAVGLAFQIPAFTPLAIGAILFLISDLLVAGESFGALRFPHLGDAVWLTYGPAQMLIVYAVNSALAASVR